MSSHRSPYQSGSGIGLQTVINYLYNTPSVIIDLLSNTLPKTAYYSAVGKTNAAFSSQTGAAVTTVISDVSSTSSQTTGLYTAPLNGSYLIVANVPGLSTQGNQLSALLNNTAALGSCVVQQQNAYTICIIPVDCKKGDTIDLKLTNNTGSGQNIYWDITYLHP